MQRRALLLLLIAAAASAQPATLEINSASQAQLESLPGIGPQLAERMLKARAEAPLRDWADLRRRVKGLGAATARKLSAQGLRVQGRAFEGAAEAPETTKSDPDSPS